MSDAPTIDAAPPGIAPGPRRLRRRVIVVGGVLAVATAAVLAIVNPFGGSPGSGGAAFDNGAPTGVAAVERRSLSSQTQVSATLGYADPATIVQPGGTSPSALTQAQQTAASAATALAGATAALAADEQALAQARASLVAARQKQAIDCRGDNAAAVNSSTGGAAPCVTDIQTVASDVQNVTAGVAKVDGDRRATASAQTALAGAQASLASAQPSATAVGQTSSYTRLPDVGAVVRRGQTLYEIDGRPVILLDGRTTAWRSFTAGMSSGRDVAELNANLRALGYGRVSGDAFTAGTGAAIEAFQAAHGLERTGRLLLGSVVFESGAVRVTTVTPATGAAVQPGPVLTVTSMRRQVTIALDASQQSGIRVGDAVTITLPDNTTTPGRVSFVGTVATSPSGQDAASQSPTIEVDVTPLRPGATGRLDEAPVNVAIETASVKNVLAVPVGALLALASGGYAVEEMPVDGSRRLVAVEVGLFDDAQGLVEVTGAGLRPGQRIVVPAQ
jgi:peptidoglycan hydrolase-like protein with peptidoglycan-binding domain